jgi:hypothetical protein
MLRIIQISSENRRRLIDRIGKGEGGGGILPHAQTGHDEAKPEVQEKL